MEVANIVSGWHLGNDIAVQDNALGCEMLESFRARKDSSMNKSFLMLALLSAPALADEGMWMPQQLPQLTKELKAAGLELDPARLTELTAYPLGAVISLG